MPLNLFKKHKTEENPAENSLKIDVPQATSAQEKTQSENKIQTKHINSEVEQIVDIEAKEKQNLRKKALFTVFSIVVISLIVISIIAPIAIKFYKENFIKVPPKVENPDNNPVIVIPEEQDPESIVEHKSDSLRLSLEHLRKSVLFEYQEESEKTRKIEIVYDKNKPGELLPTEELTEGYIFRVSTFSTTFRQIDDIAKVKKEAVTLACPDTATISNTLNVFVDGIEGRSFEVKNCGADYKISYVVKNNLNYEFTQVFKGDLGYRQAYKAETENILGSIKFYPDEKPDLGPIETYINDNYNFSFEYPRYLSTECCTITGPISNGSQTLLILGDTESETNEDTANVIGLFIDGYRDGDFNTYLEKQKSLLTDDYIITKSEAPKPEIRTIQVGEKEATMLRGYSWRGNDLTYIDISESSGKEGKVLVISTRGAEEEFEEVLNSILDSFKFSLTE